MSYKEEALAIIKETKVINEDDFKSIQELKDELEDTFWTAQMFRTETEARISVLTDMKFPTPDAKYWQSKREQNVHFEQLVFLGYESQKLQQEMKEKEIQIENFKLDIEELKVQISLSEPESILVKKTKNEIALKEVKIKQLEIELDKQRFILTNNKRTAQERVREIKMWSKIKKELEPQMKYSSKDVNEHQLVSYTQRFIAQFYNLIQSKFQGTVISELNNLTSQLDQGIKTCIQCNVIDKVIDGLPAQISIPVLKFAGKEDLAERAKLMYESKQKVSFIK